METVKTDHIDRKTEWGLRLRAEFNPQNLYKILSIVAHAFVTTVWGRQAGRHLWSLLASQLSLIGQPWVPSKRLSHKPK